MVICNECGYQYSSHHPYCPECGNPTVKKFVNQTGLSNCPNCGAPVTNNIACEYCDSAFPSVVVNKAPEKVIINNTTNVKENSSSSFATGAAAFLGGIIGGILSD